MAKCLLCPVDDNSIDDSEMLDHLRVIHPEEFGDGPTRWPDGDVVVTDMTLEPADFAEGRP